MEKKHYFVSVQARSILEGQGDAAYEFEIEASEEDIDRLKAMFDEIEAFEQDGWFRSHVPFVPYHNDQANDGYDYYLKEVYRLLYETGTEETKRHLATMMDGFATMGQPEP